MIVDRLQWAHPVANKNTEIIKQAVDFLVGNNMSIGLWGWRMRDSYLSIVGTAKVQIVLGIWASLIDPSPKKIAHFRCSQNRILYALALPIYCKLK
jgi:hypothetical protein